MKNWIFTLGAALLLFACSKESSLEAVADGQSGSITRFAIFQHYMYVLNLNEVQTYDISDEKHPVLVHRLSTDYGLETITIYDGAIFLGSTTALYIVNIDNPAAPVIQAKTDRLLDFGFSGCDPVVVKDDYAYSTIKIIENVCGTISAQSALVVYSIADKSNPVAVGLYPLDVPNGLGYKDNYLFVCDEGADEVIVFDITDPRALVQTNYGIAVTDPYDLIVDGETMIVSSKTNFELYDVSDVAHIRKIGQITK
jgi:hypothetical protein